MTSLPTEIYRSPTHALKEQELFQRGWLMAALSSRLPQYNSAIAVYVMGISVLLTRDNQGIVRAFENNCVHRGTQLLKPSKKAVHQEGIHCRYHGWGYNLQGAVQHIPRKNGFSCTPSHLHQYQVVERLGMIWICLNEPKMAFDEFIAPIEPRLQHYQLDEMQPIESRDFEFAVNWKISLENSLDFYHVAIVHPKTVGVHVQVQPTFQDLQWHNLQTLFIAPYRWRKMLDQHCARYREYTEQELSSLHKYCILPNLVINVLPYHLTVMQFWPIDVNTCVMRYQFCQRKGAGLVEKSRAYASWLASRIILYEDVQLYRSIQQGFQSTSLKEQVLHDVEERGVIHFNQAILRWLQPQ